MSQAESHTDRIIIDAQALLDKVRQDLAQADEFYRSTGINPDKVLPALEQFMGAKEKAELEKIMAADQDAIQREVDEGAARANFATPVTSGAAKRPRPMV